MKRYVVVGAGLMGRVIAQDLLQSEQDASVSLCDVSEALLSEATELIGDDRLAVKRVDARDGRALAAALRGHACAVGALPHALSLTLVRAAVEAGTSLVDLVGEAPSERAGLDGHAREKGCLIVPGCGVAPGISNACVGQAVHLLDAVENGAIYVGGIPRKKRPPLYYETVYLLESVFNAYTREAVILESGRAVKVPPLSGLETVEFPEPVGPLEAFFTDGLASLALTMAGKVKGRLFEKTLRHPGHVERIDLLKQCGLLEEKPLRVGDQEVIPRKVLLELLKERLRLGPEGDVLAMRVVVSGRSEGRERTHSFELVDFFDESKRHTAMARTTGYTAACAARMVASWTLAEKGVCFPEDLFVGARFEDLTRQLGERGIEIRHAVS